MKALFLKRPFDMILSLLGLCLSFPQGILFALLIKLEDGGPIFYLQDRVGKGGRLFKAYKFRSMIPDAERDGRPVQAAEHDPRVTTIGRLLRITAMDELPQLFNILKGDMSFVGPRALRPLEKERNAGGLIQALEDFPGFKKRQSIRPGLTGIAQIFLPADSSLRKKFRYDLLYIKKMSFWLDMKLIFLSFWITCRGKWETSRKKF